MVWQCHFLWESLGPTRTMKPSPGTFSWQPTLLTGLTGPKALAFATSQRSPRRWLSFAHNEPTWSCAPASKSKPMKRTQFRDSTLCLPWGSSRPISPTSLLSEFCSCFQKRGLCASQEARLILQVTDQGREWLARATGLLRDDRDLFVCKGCRIWAVYSVVLQPVGDLGVLHVSLGDRFAGCP